MNDYQKKLCDKMDVYVHGVYKVTKIFPKEETFGVTSQFRRSSLSVVLNYIEGYARGRLKSRLHFLEISFASLQESKYLLKFSFEEKYLLEDNYQKLKSYSEEISAMLWKEIENISNHLKNFSN
ncbi:hypothetical protein A2223_04320 [Candidatus Falkowbacteria bacterium RIFOXYA2_FULL_35_8]|uniref:Four helix bundle protein n=1 Tax=Candidatus Falkowbacteria bacterium RIFOXYC2_FULL_36_12 TaxID=1798002 RepID=A0A1F5SYK3_9BACT|nr:MAG: hypothetical protein A2300_02790 [Candidatus Falkowbacteria bacterium RIFOXYB2_FULL_35_7]OGF31729.1 MAG: hypothetical protein A2478_04560 [Candidatus Falkowbacteria bacterium RIFOXYC2_FULL_36_12]OGF34065.1 MAG: hypothetical protein A2223_04320 [Candidatus Falkowbacteria bacterium RIFOXYA2_FULL_35_8]